MCECHWLQEAVISCLARLCTPFSEPSGLLSASSLPRCDFLVATAGVRERLVSDFPFVRH